MLCQNILLYRVKVEEGRKQQNNRLMHKSSVRKEVKKGEILKIQT